MESAQTPIIDQYRSLHFDAVEFLHKLDSFLELSESINVPLVAISQIARVADSINDFTKFTGSYELPNIGDACSHSAHIPEAPGQGGANERP